MVKIRGYSIEMKVSIEATIADQLNPLKKNQIFFQAVNWRIILFYNTLTFHRQCFGRICEE